MHGKKAELFSGWRLYSKLFDSGIDPRRNGGVAASCCERRATRMEFCRRMSKIEKGKMLEIRPRQRGMRVSLKQWVMGVVHGPHSTLSLPSRNIFNLVHSGLGCCAWASFSK